MPAPRRHGGRQDAFAANNDEPDVPRNLNATALDLGDPFMPVRGRQVDNGDSLLAQERIERGDGQDIAWWSHHDRRASQQRRDNLFDGDVERQRGEVQHAIAGAKLVGSSGRGGMICQRAVGDDYSLRLAGRAGGIDDVSGRIGARSGRRRESGVCLE